MTRLRVSAILIFAIVLTSLAQASEECPMIGWQYNFTGGHTRGHWYVYFENASPLLTAGMVPQICTTLHKNDCEQNKLDPIYNCKWIGYATCTVAAPKNYNEWLYLTRAVAEETFDPDNVDCPDDECPDSTAGNPVELAYGEKYDFGPVETFVTLPDGSRFTFRRRYSNIASPDDESMKSKMTFIGHGWTHSFSFFLEDQPSGIPNNNDIYTHKYFTDSNGNQYQFSILRKTLSGTAALQNPLYDSGLDLYFNQSFPGRGAYDRYELREYIDAETNILFYMVRDFNDKSQYIFDTEGKLTGIRYYRVPEVNYIDVFYAEDGSHIVYRLFGIEGVYTAFIGLTVDVNGSVTGLYGPTKNEASLFQNENKIAEYTIDDDELISVHYAKSGSEWQYDYDADHRMISRIKPGDEPQEQRTASYVYNADGRVISSVTFGGYEPWEFSYTDTQTTATRKNDGGDITTTLTLTRKGNHYNALGADSIKEVQGNVKGGCGSCGGGAINQKYEWFDRNRKGKNQFPIYGMIMLNTWSARWKARAMRSSARLGINTTI